MKKFIGSDWLRKVKFFEVAQCAVQINRTRAEPGNESHGGRWHVKD